MYKQLYIYGADSEFYSVTPDITSATFLATSGLVSQMFNCSDVRPGYTEETESTDYENNKRLIENTYWNNIRTIIYPERKYTSTDAFDTIFKEVAIFKKRYKAIYIPSTIGFSTNTAIQINVKSSSIGDLDEFITTEIEFEKVQSE